MVLTGRQRFARVLAADISASTPVGWSNFVSAFGILRTVAGKGEYGVDITNFWQSGFEGNPATSANLSRPHFAMADTNGNLFIVDKDSHSVLKVTSDGNIHTAAGTHTAGFNGDGPGDATTLQLNFPNGLWVRSDGVFYVLDTDNGKVRKVETNGVMSTLFTVDHGIVGGRGLWVKEDESVVYFCDGPDVRKRVPGNITTVNNKNFVDLGNLVVNPQKELIVTDRGANRVYRLNKDGSRDPIAGDGSTNGIVSGTLALANGLHGVRGVWWLPNNGYLLALHEGSQIAYVDPTGVIYVFLDGAPGNTHAGDGAWFYTQGQKIGEARSVTMDPLGNVIICENDNGFVRVIPFLRLSP